MAVTIIIRDGFIVLDGKAMNDIASIDINKLFLSIGLDQHLSPNRRNGFYAMLQRVDHFIQTNS
jgi:cysteine desulfuration protein SufE